MTSLTGVSPNNPRDYLGQNVSICSVVTRNRAPTSADVKQPETGKLYPFNTFWLVGKNPTTGVQGDLWYLSKIDANESYWVLIGAASGPLLNISVPDGVSPIESDASGTVFLTSSGGTIQITGSSASPNNHTINFDLVGGGVAFDQIQVQQVTAPGVNPVEPDPNTGLVTFNGAAVANHSVPVETRTRALNEFNLEVQYGTTAAAPDVTKNGLVHFNSSQFTVDASDGFVSLTGAGTNFTKVGVTAASGTGTNPVLPDGAGLITVNGGQVASGVVGANVIQTNSLNANQYTIQVQQSGSDTVQDTTLNGVCHFDSDDFTVTNGFVELAAGAGSTSIAVDDDTAPGTNPVLPNMGVITMTGGQVASGTIGAKAIQTNSLAANSLTIQVQQSGSAAAQNTDLNGICHFDSDKFSVTNGFVELLGSANLGSLTVNSVSGTGVNPVVPSGGTITISGQQIAAASTANVINTNSNAPNQFDIQIQRSTTTVAADQTKNGVSHFNDSHFVVTAEGFVSLSGGGGGGGISSLVTDIPGPLGPPTVTVTGTNIYSDGSTAATMKLNLQGTNNALYVGRGNQTPSASLAVGTTGTALLGVTGNDPTWGSVPNSVLTNSSVTINSGNNITVTGGSPLSLGGVASVAVTGTTNFAVQVGNASGSLTSLATGSSGQILQSAGAANPGWTTTTYPSTSTQGDVIYASANNTLTTLAKDTNATRYLSNTGASNAPAWAQVNLSNGVTGTLPVTNGGTSVASFTAYTPICGGTTSTGALQSVASTGTAGQVLTSNGAGALPTFQTISGTLLTATLVLTSAQVKALRATPQTVIAAPGAGNVILVISAITKMTYGGTNAFTNGQLCELRYNGSTSNLTQSLCTITQIQATASTYALTDTFSVIQNFAATAIENAALIIQNAGASEITGNAANNNTLTVQVVYKIVTI